MPLSETPTWDDHISVLFSKPYWLPEGIRDEIGKRWIHAMNEWGVTKLSSYEIMSERVVTVYEHLRSRSMPLTDDPTQYFPVEALEMIKRWANQGCRKSSGEEIATVHRIEEPRETEKCYRVRKDIRSLTGKELQTYRMKLDDVLRVGEVQGKWQELGFLHANWCLHYQEGTFPWHRAMLRYVEELIDFPIPYWNGLAVEATDPSSDYAGLPREFLDEEYIHPSLGVRKNPLKYALALVHDPSNTSEIKYVERDSILVSRTPGQVWNTKILHFKIYQRQINLALQQASYSQPLKEIRPLGKPWANIPDFTEDMGDYLYPNRADFDGLFEQPHDNIHGWVGGDMSDNSRTAFDPVFLSYHANMDRITDIYIQSRPELTFTANFPLRPFANYAKELQYSDSRRWIYTTIGEMVRDTRIIGYMYAPPASPDQIGSGPFPTLQTGELIPYAVFHDVGCNLRSFQIDVFTPSADSLVPDPVGNKEYIGRDTRLGMGLGKKGNGLENMDRCAKRGVTRMLDAAQWSEKLKDVDGESLKQVVVDLETGRDVPEEEWSQWSGFKATLVWTRRI